MHTNNIAALAALMVLIAPGAFAADSMGAQVTNITEETEILKAKIEREELRAKLAKLSGASQAHDSSRATVEWVEGIGSDRAAMIRMSQGWKIEVKAGDRLPDGAIIKEIRPNRVSISRNGRSEWLEFASSAPSALPQAGVAGNPTAPAMAYPR